MHKKTLLIKSVYCPSSFLSSELDVIPGIPGKSQKINIVYGNTEDVKSLDIIFDHISKKFYKIIGVNCDGNKYLTSEGESIIKNPFLSKVYGADVRINDIVYIDSNLLSKYTYDNKIDVTIDKNGILQEILITKNITDRKETNVVFLLPLEIFDTIIYEDSEFYHLKENGKVDKSICVRLNITDYENLIQFDDISYGWNDNVYHKLNLMNTDLSDRIQKKETETNKK